jgi:hypothetical protein
VDDGQGQGPCVRHGYLGAQPEIDQGQSTVRRDLKQNYPFLVI